MKKPILILLILITGRFCFSQTGTIKGYIQDNIENEGLALAQVYLVDSMIGTYTDLNGNFIIDSIPDGTYDLKIFSIGYGDTLVKSIQVFKDSVTLLVINFPPPCPKNVTNKVCPLCKSDDKLIPIRYGVLIPTDFKEEVYQVQWDGKPCDPRWFCKRDELKF